MQSEPKEERLTSSNKFLVLKYFINSDILFFPTQLNKHNKLANYQVLLLSFPVIKL